MNYFLGFDGGGTKTECVLVDSDGHVLAQALGGPSNPLRTGYAKAWFALSAVADAVLAKQHIKATDIRGICAGLGGSGRPRAARRVASFFERAFPQAVVQVTTDIEIALEAAVGAGEGIVLIAGTGSVACGRNAAGQTARAGGWGPWIGDEGSAFDIGRRAVRAVTRARDGLGPPTQLADRVLGPVECPNWDALIERIAKNPDEVFPRIFPLVVEVADGGDAPAREILLEAAVALSELARAVIEALGLGNRTFLLAKAGGAFGRSAILDQAVDAHLARIALRARIDPLRTAPALAAAHRARLAFSKTAQPQSGKSAGTTG
jgi:N-acetylglucosamine kinase-like BadF-type ATPase